MIFTFMQFSMGDAFNYPVCLANVGKQTNKMRQQQQQQKQNELMNCNAVGKKCHCTIGLCNKLSE